MSVNGANGWWYYKRRMANKLMWVGAVLGTLIAILPLAMVVYSLLLHGIPALNWAFFTHLPKPVGESGGGMANAIVGSLILISLASLFGLPIGICGGIYLAEFGNNRLGAVLRFTADVLASVPSIIVGVLVWTLVVEHQKHFSAFAGGVALGIMMIPTVTRTTEELVRMVPMSQREAALSLGVTHFRTVLSVVMASAKAGVITGILLAIARISGETAPLLLTSSTSQYWSMSPNKPIASLPYQIFIYAISPYDDWHAKAWGGALVLVAMILILSIAARYSTRGRFRLVR